MIRFSTSVLVGAAALVVAGMAAPALRQAHWRLAMDPQSVACLPWTMYVEHVRAPRTLHRGQIVVLREDAVDKAALLNPGLRAFASAPAGKMVAALPGDTVELKGGAIWIDGDYMGKTWLSSWVGRHFQGLSVPWVAGKPYVIPPGKVMVMGTSALAFDSRYFGLVNVSQIHGVAYPL